MNFRIRIIPNATNNFTFEPRQSAENRRVYSQTVGRGNGIFHAAGFPIAQGTITIRRNDGNQVAESSL